MDKVDVAAVLPVYNGGRETRLALDCLLEQTVQPAEIIAINDGSTDETPKVLSEYEGKHDTVRVLTHETNKGLPTALNTGIKATDRTYIARQDVDDRSRPNRIEEQYHYMTGNPHVDVVGTAATVIDDDLNSLATVYPPSNPSTVIYERNPFVHGSVMMRREAIEDVDGYDPLFESAQDYDLWIRLNRAGHQLDSMQTVLYDLKRPRTHLSVAQRQRRVLFGLAARGDADQKEQYRSVILSQDIEEIYDLLPRTERAVYNRQSAEICIKQGSWATAIQEIAPAIIHDPLSVRTGGMLGLSLLPPLVSQKILKAIQVF